MFFPQQFFFRETLLNASLERVFSFFSDPKNLECITPPFLNFRIVHQTTPTIQPGTELTYNLKIHAIPVTWVSRIECFIPNEKFVDVQLKGPYKLWHHTHLFEPQGNQTLMKDEVRYELPFGKWGLFFGGKFVAKDIENIFNYREAHMHRLLKELES